MYEKYIFVLLEWQPSETYRTYRSDQIFFETRTKKKVSSSVIVAK